MRLFIAEDERDLNSILVSRFKEEHYSVDSCYDGETAWAYVSSVAYDAVILDILMPEMDGITLLKKMRASGIWTPVLFLSAKDEVSDRVAGLDAGANDYLAKPFSFEELMARIRVLTRKSVDGPTDYFVLDDLEVDCKTRRVTRGGREIRLTAKEFAILELLIRNRGIVLSKDSIIDHVWDYSFEGADDIVKVYIRYLRKKIDNGFEKKLLHTVRSYGYVLKEEA